MSDLKIIKLPKHGDRRGNLSLVQSFLQVPFDIHRVFWIYDVPGDSIRGGHAYYTTEEFVVALSGSFDVVVNDGVNEYIYHLNRSYYGLYIPKMMWREMKNFSTNSVALVIANTQYDERDYILDFDKFKNYIYSKTIDSHFNLNVLKPRKYNHVDNRLTVYDCSVINLPKFNFDEGNLTVVESYTNLPFKIERAFYLYDIPGGEARGAHAHKQCHQFLIAASGSFEIVLDDGVNKRTVLLNRSFYGIHIPPGIWAAEQGFSSGSVCLVLASDRYDENDYIRDYEEFLNYRGIKK